MRVIERDVVGAFIFSADGKILLGHNKKGGTYQGLLVVPGGGIEANETQLDAVKREMLEELGLDLSHSLIRQLEHAASGESEKTLEDTGEVVLMRMKFYDFEVRLSDNADSIQLTFEDDFGDAQWYSSAELEKAPVGPNSKVVLQKLRFL